MDERTFITTTQEYGANANFIAGSLNAVNITLANVDVDSKPTHKYWKNDITAAAAATAPNLIAGVEYEVKTLGSGTNAPDAADWKSIGVKKVDAMGDPAVPAVGDKFIAEKEGVLRGGDIAFADAFVGGTTAASVFIDNTQNALAKIIRSVQNFATISFVGEVRHNMTGMAFSNDGGAQVRLLLENAGSENFSRDNNGDLPKGYDDEYPLGDARQLQKSLRELERREYNLPDVRSTSEWTVAQFEF